MEIKATFAAGHKARARFFGAPAAMLRGQALAFVVAVLGCCSYNGKAEDALEKPRKEWFELSQTDALRHQPVEVQGTVLCYDLGWGQFYIHDGSKTIYISPRLFTNHFEAGQSVSIEGDTTWDEAGVTLTNVTALVTGNKLLPQPAPLKLADLGDLYGQWIETSGQVRVAEASRDRVTLVLNDGHQECLVYIMQTSSRTDFKRLADCWVRIRGINASRTENGRLDEARVFVPGMNCVKIIAPAENLRWQLPVTAIDTLLAQPQGEWTNRPVHVNGLLSAYLPGKNITIKDPTGLLEAEVIQVNPALLYQRVDAWGFLTIKTNRIVLSDAYFEISSQSHAVEGSVPKTRQDTAKEPTLTSIRQIRLLSKERANENLPALIHGQLTCVDLEWRVVFLQDGHDAIFLDTAQSDLAAGQWVEVTGQTDGRGFAPQLINCSTRIMGATNRPVALKVDLEDVVNGQMDSQWVEMEGVVRRISKDGAHITLVMASPNGKFTAIVQDSSSEPAPAEFLDALVSLRGACGSIVNSRGQISGIALRVPSRNEITIIDPSPSDPFAIAPTLASAVATYNPGRVTGRRVKLTGVVTFVAPGGSLFLQDASGGMRVRGSQIGEVHVGERIDALGFPALFEFSPCLDEAVIRHIGRSALPEAKATTAEEILQSGNQDALIVELTGKTLQDISQGAQARLILQEGPVIFSAQLDQPGPQKLLPDLSPGSLVRVRGVCAIQSDENNEPATFRILLADTSGLTLIKGPSWWSPRHTMILGGGVVFGSLLVSVWVVSLRRRVRSQTEIIRQNQNELIATSRQAGMAEVATSVLHNVGNVLNSVNISASLAHERVRSSRVIDLHRLVQLFDEHAHDLAAFLTSDPKGKLAPTFLKRLAERLGTEQAALTEDLTSLVKNVEHIKEIVAMQQSYARVSGLFENIQVAELLDDTLRMNEGSLDRHDIKVVRDFKVLPTICTDKHKALQILINLVRNAKYACDESGRSDKQMILRATNGDGRVKIAIIDNGVGIPPENLTRIFNHGFTTRKEGHGFALHSGALAAKELGGSLTAQSEGLGSGAVFTLELPCKRPRATN